MKSFTSSLVVISPSRARELPFELGPNRAVVASGALSGRFVDIIGGVATVVPRRAFVTLSLGVSSVHSPNSSRRTSVLYWDFASNWTVITDFAFNVWLYCLVTDTCEAGWAHETLT